MTVSLIITYVCNLSIKINKNFKYGKKGKAKIYKIYKILKNIKNKK
jgi:hypothetical protein